MIDAVNTSTVQSASLRPTSQTVAFSPVSAAASFSSQYVSSRIRMDNQLNVAILEFRSGSSGEVIRQYPTEFQLRAFQRAAQLETPENSPALDVTLSEGAVSGPATGSVDIPTVAVAAPVSTTTAASTPSSSGAPAPTQSSVLV